MAAMLGLSLYQRGSDNPFMDARWTNCMDAANTNLSYSVGSGLMGAETDLLSGSGFSTSSLSRSSSESRRLLLSSVRSSLLLLSSSLLLLSSSLLWLFLDLLTSKAFPQLPFTSRKADRQDIKVCDGWLLCFRVSIPLKFQHSNVLKSIFLHAGFYWPYVSPMLETFWKDHKCGTVPQPIWSWLWDGLPHYQQSV